MVTETEEQAMSRVKSDNPELIGKHVFEAAGLGIGPFRCIGMVEEAYQACADAPIQPAGTCQYCGACIRYCYIVQGKGGGKAFKVGSDCLTRTGDGNLIKSYKNLPEVREAARQKRYAADARVQATLKEMLADTNIRTVLANSPTVGTWNGQEESALAFIERSLPWCGMAGRARNLQFIKRCLEAKSA